MWCVCVCLPHTAVPSVPLVSPLLKNNTGLPREHSDKELTCQHRRHGRLGFDPWVRKIPWRRKWQPTPVFLPGESHGQRSLEGYSPWGCKESDTTEWLTHIGNTHTHTHTHTHTQATFHMDFPGGSVVKNPSTSAGDSGLIPGSGRSPGVGNGNPLQ